MVVEKFKSPVKLIWPTLDRLLKDKYAMKRLEVLHYEKVLEYKRAFEEGCQGVSGEQRKKLELEHIKSLLREINTMEGRKFME